MENTERKTTRRSLFKYALGTLGTLAAPIADMAQPAGQNDRGYTIVDRRVLAGGGVGLFIAVPPAPTAEALRALGEQLREDFANEPTAVIEIFDDAAASRTVLSGSRVVGETRFAEARAHQVASYLKYQHTGRHSLTILGAVEQTIRY